jgi:predicted secreted hydrolase
LVGLSLRFGVSPHVPRLHFLTLSLTAIASFVCGVESQTTVDGFAIPQSGRAFTFPRDHGSHPDFRTEWWYITGHLQTEQNHRFGFQATFFRQAQRGADGVVSQMYLSHTALLDVETGKFISDERLNREGWDAEASAEKLEVRNGSWTLHSTGENLMQLECAVHADAALSLALEATKPLVIFGENGVSRKGASASAASHYLTWPRLRVTGSVRLGAKDERVVGEAWMDHEFSSSQLDEKQVGWDWASVQFKDGTELMVYRLRLADGRSDASSSLTFIDKGGVQSHAMRDDFEWTSLDQWKSPRTLAKYPQHVRVAWPVPVGDSKRSIELRPVAEDQELHNELSGLPYWEGACDVFDEQGKLIGQAFLELAGYAGDLARHLRKNPAIQFPPKN